MRKILSDIRSGFKKAFGSKTEAEELSEGEKDYLELDTEGHDAKSKVVVRPFVINDFTDIKEILDTLREGYTIALINIKPLKDKDLVDLKRAINKLKKTCDAIDGDIAGFGEDYIVVTPSFAHIHRTKQTSAVRSEPVEE